MTPYQEGYNEGRSGKYNAINPYSQVSNPTSYSEWDRGLRDGFSHYSNMMQPGV